MKRSQPEAEYRFDLVEEPEWEDCFNWELYRECCRRDRLALPKPWRLLRSQEKANFRKVCWFDMFGKVEPVSIAPPMYGARLEPIEGRELSSSEVITFPPVLVRWEYSNTRIADAFRDLIYGWVKEQRNTNPNAAHFNENAEMGPPPKALIMLARLAAWRLSRLDKLKAPEIEMKLAKLLGLLVLKRKDADDTRAKAATSLEKGRQVGELKGNLSRWCRKIDSLLRKK